MDAAPNLRVRSSMGLGCSFVSSGPSCMAGKKERKKTFFPFLPIWGAGVNFAAFAFGGTDRRESGKSGLLTSSFLPSAD